MPCFDGGPDPRSEKIDLLQRKVKKTEAMLCGIVTVLSNSGKLNDIISDVNWIEVGVTPSVFLSWWEDHQEADRLRRKREHEKEQLRLKKIEEEKAQRRRLFEELKKEFGDS